MDGRPDSITSPQPRCRFTAEMIAPVSSGKEPKMSTGANNKRRTSVRIADLFTLQLRVSRKINSFTTVVYVRNVLRVLRLFQLLQKFGEAQQTAEILEMVAHLFFLTTPPPH